MNRTPPPATGLPHLQWQELSDNAGATAFFEDDGSAEEAAVGPLLSAEEQRLAAGFGAASERRDYLLRRFIQRSFVARFLHWNHALAEIPLIHQRDERPCLAGRPDLSLSFSASGRGMVAAASRECHIGIDIEAVRSVAQPLALAQRFFATSECEWLATQPPATQAMDFQRMWAAKEACLKAIGTGVVFGPERFILTPSGSTFTLSPPAGYGNVDAWKIDNVIVTKGYFSFLARCKRTRSK